MFSVITENLARIKENIKVAAQKSGRKEDEILLVGVTKTIDTQRVQALVDLGVKNLGENKVQELNEKFDKIHNDPIWHLIGHLQTNKVKQVIDKVALVHSVDSLKLAYEIDKRASEIGKIVDILVEVNVADEASKFGISEYETMKFVEEIVEFANVRLRGLMTIAPFVENPQENKLFFSKMRNLFIDISRNFDDNGNIEFLSMGMTNDYTYAIEEGANIVRVGTGIFGERKYTQN